MRAPGTLGLEGQASRPRSLAVSCASVVAVVEGRGLLTVVAEAHTSMVEAEDPAGVVEPGRPVLRAQVAVGVVAVLDWPATPDPAGLGAPGSS
jgi:hypothetical protein